MKTVLFLFGGKSNEHEVSIMSANNVYAYFPSENYICIPVYVDKSGIWYGAKEQIREIPKTSNEVKELFTEKVELEFENSVTTIEISDKEYKIDILYPLIHGQGGEDGTIQGLARSFCLPVVGPSMETALVTYDKDITKALVSRSGVIVASSITYTRGGEIPSWELINEMLGNIVFIKPARSGSSIGVSIARNEIELKSGIGLALKEDTKILIESAVVGREIEVAVFVSPNGERKIAEVIGEIVPPENDFYSYEEKYEAQSKTGLIIGAHLTDAEGATIINAVQKTISAISLVGSARIDFFLTKDGVAVLNEINTIPGFTNISMYPKLFEASGTNFKELIRLMIDNAN